MNLRTDFSVLIFCDTGFESGGQIQVRIYSAYNLVCTTRRDNRKGCPAVNMKLSEKFRSLLEGAVERSETEGVKIGYIKL